MNTTETYRTLIKAVLEEGDETNPRGLRTREILNYSCSIDMNYPIVNCLGRQLSMPFMFKEAAWILEGRVDLSPDLAATLERFSSHELMTGAYGPRIMMQLPYVIDLLMEDCDTRQAVIHVHMPLNYITKDVPCTKSLQWVIRNNELHCLANMRSSDSILGVPYDWFNFSAISGYIVSLINDARREHAQHSEEIPLRMGRLYWNAASQHLYETDFDMAKGIIVSTGLQFNYEYQFNFCWLPAKDYVKAFRRIVEQGGPYE